MAEVTIWREDTPQGETITDEFAATQGFTKPDGTGDAQAFANNLIATAGYSANPVPLNASFGGGTPTATGNELSSDEIETPEYFNLYTSLLNKTEEILSGVSTDTEEESEELFVPTIEQAGQLVPYMRNKGNLLQVYVDTWAETGNDQLALQAVRDSDEYETYFPGNSRIDPTTGEAAGIRYDEATYTALTDAYDRAFIEAGLNPDVFREAEVYPALVSGDVGSQELTSRINAAREAFIDNPLAENVRAYYSQNFDIDMTDSALLASALDPAVGERILNRQIAVAQIGAEASARAFDITLQESERLYQLGVTGTKAAQLFSQAESLLGRVQTMAAAQGRGEFGISQYLEAEALEVLKKNKDLEMY